MTIPSAATEAIGFIVAVRCRGKSISIVDGWKMFVVTTRSTATPKLLPHDR